MANIKNRKKLQLIQTIWDVMLYSQHFTFHWKLLGLVSRIEKSGTGDNNFGKWKGTFRSDRPKWPDQSQWTTFKAGPEDSGQTKPKWAVPFDVPTEITGILGWMESTPRDACEIWGMFIRSAWKLTSSANSEKDGKALCPSVCCNFWTLVDHLVLNQPGRFSTRLWSFDEKSKIFRLGMWSLAISTCCRKSLNSCIPFASLCPILGQLVSLFSKSALRIAEFPKRYFNLFLDSL